MSNIAPAIPRVIPIYFIHPTGSLSIMAAISKTKTGFVVIINAPFMGDVSERPLKNKS